MATDGFPSPHPIKVLWSMGFGAINMSTLVQIGESNPASLLSNTLLANTPQLILSCLYFCYNSIFTCELVGREWNQLGHRRQPLRVSQPQGQQISTYRLNLPYRYGVPLIATATLLHWLFSRAIFLVNITFANPLKSFGINNDSFEDGLDSHYRKTSLIRCG